jgi:hypothetical protein
MNWILYIVLGAIFVAGFLAWGFIHITRRTADAAAALGHVEEHQIHSLVEECIRICDQKLGTGLDLHNFAGSAENLDFLLEPKRRMRTKTAFEIPDHTGRFVLPLGAFLGELVRTHVPGSRWVPRKGGGLAMEIPQSGETLTMHPFDKVLKHAATGKEGELLTYINVAAGKAQLQ